jgi:hypothetical protein
MPHLAPVLSLGLVKPSSSSRHSAAYNASRVTSNNRVRGDGSRYNGAGANDCTSPDARALQDDCPCAYKNVFTDHHTVGSGTFNRPLSMLSMEGVMVGVGNDHVCSD